MKRIITLGFLMLCYLFITTTVSAFTRVYVKLVTDNQSWLNVTVDANNIVKTIGTGGDYPDFTSIDFNSTGLNLQTGDEVWVAKGLYPFSKQLPTIANGISIYGGFAGTETAVSKRTRSDLDGNGIVESWEFTNATKFVGLGNSSSTPQNYRMMILNNGKTLDGITISDVYYSNSGSTTYGGGGEIQTGALIRNSIIQNISTVCTSNNGVNGGGLYVNRGGIDGCLVENCYCDILSSNNTGTTAGAGILVNGSANDNSSTCTGYVINSVIRNCTAGSSTGAKSASGGGIYANIGARVENCVIYNNSAYANSTLGGNSQGGGIIGNNSGDSNLKGNYFVNLTVVNNFSNLYPSFFPASNYASAYNCIVWQNGNGGTTAAPTYSGSSIRISATTTITGYPYLDYIFYNSDPTTPITNGTNNKANPFNAFTAKVILSGTDNSTYPGFTRPTTFVGSSYAQADINSIRQANWSLTSTSPIINKGVAAPTNATTTSLQVKSPYVSGTNTYTFSPTDISGATVGTQYQLGAYGRFTYKLNVVVGNNGSLFEEDGITTSKSIYPVFANDAKKFKVVPANGYILTSATISNTTLTPDASGIITIPEMTADATLSLSFNPKVSTFSKSGSSYWSTTTDWTYTPVAETDLVIASGELIIDQTPISVNSITVTPGAKLTLNSGITLKTGLFTLQSSESGAATFTDNGGTLNATSTIVQQYLSSSRNWYMSSPVSGAIALPTTDSGTLTFYNYLENDANQATGINGYPAGGVWNSVNSGIMNESEGYIIHPSATTSTVSFTGTGFNTGDQTISGLSYSLANPKHGFNLIGNPYPSYLNVLPSISANVNLEPTVWYRTRDNANYYHYETVNASTGVGTNASSTGRVTGYIPPMQGFWVKTNSDNQSIKLFNANRSHTTSVDLTQYDLGSVPTTPLKVSAQKQQTYSLLGLNVSNGITNDETIIMFVAGASSGLDIYDSKKMSNNNLNIPELFTTVDGSQLAINSMNDIQKDSEIPLGFTTGVGGTSFSIKATQLSNFDVGTQVILKDNLDINNPVITDISDGNSYFFNSEATMNNTSRFSVIFKTRDVSTENVNGNDYSDPVSVFKNDNNQITIKFANVIPNQVSVNLYTALGQELEEKILTGSISVLCKSLTAGVYFVNLTVKGKRYVRKIIIN